MVSTIRQSDPPVNTDPDRFIRENTSVLSPPHVPEIRLHLASEAHDLWHKTEEELETLGLPPPFWAFAWAGGQALARIGKPLGQTVDPQPPVRVQHHLDHGRIFQKPRNGRPERGPQHARTALDRFRSVMVGGHVGPVSWRGRDRRSPDRGRLREAEIGPVQQVFTSVLASAAIGGK